MASFPKDLFSFFNWSFSCFSRAAFTLIPSKTLLGRSISYSGRTCSLTTTGPLRTNSLSCFTLNPGNYLISDFTTWLIFTAMPYLRLAGKNCLITIFRELNQPHSLFVFQQHQDHNGQLVVFVIRLYLQLRLFLSMVYLLQSIIMVNIHSRMKVLFQQLNVLWAAVLPEGSFKRSNRFGVVLPI